MNKTLMLVICDFLLLSMLALARFDPPEEAEAKPALNATASSATAEAELIELLEESLQSELSSRENLTEDLTATREDLQAKAQELAEREAELARKAAEAAALAESKAQIENDQKELLTKIETAQSKLAEISQERTQLNQSLLALEQESNQTKENLNQTQADLVARELALAEREAALKAAQEEAAKLTEERETLNRQLEVAQAEKRLLAENLSREQAEKEAAYARAERLSENVSQLGQGVSQLGEGVSQIGQGVTTLKEASDQIQKEMDEGRPRTMSEIFTRFQNNRATLRFQSTEKGLLGSTNDRTYESKSILIQDTLGAYYLVTHASNTPFAFNKSSDSVLSASLSVQLAGQSFDVPQIAFHSADPRLIFIPLSKSVVENSGLTAFQLALQPERWEEAVLIKSDESNFGRTGFRRLTSSNRFLRMDRPALGEIFAEFASSRGDFAFSKNSRFIGVLTDKTHAIVLDDFVASGVLTLGERYSQPSTTETINRLKDRVRRLPEEVQ